eukprot:3337172-Pyramimonas_sp.AAC.1
MMINDCTTPAGHIYAAKQARMQALLRFGSVKRRKLATFAVGDPLDSAPPSVEQSAKNLAVRWGEVHRAPPHPPSVGPRVLADLGREFQQISPGISWELEEFEFRS